MSVDLRKLEHFLAVAEDLDFTRAADRLHISQQDPGGHDRCPDLRLELPDDHGSRERLTTLGRYEGQRGPCRVELIILL